MRTIRLAALALTICVIVTYGFYWGNFWKEYSKQCRHQGVHFYIEGPVETMIDYDKVEPEVAELIKDILARDQTMQSKPYFEKARLLAPFKGLSSNGMHDEYRFDLLEASSQEHKEYLESEMERGILHWAILEIRISKRCGHLTNCIFMESPL